MSSRLFGQAIAAAGRLASGGRSSGRSSAAMATTMANSVLRGLGPLGQLISNMIAGPRREITRDSEAEAAAQILRQLRRLSPDRRLAVADALLQEEVGRGAAPPAPPVVAPQSQPSGGAPRKPGAPVDAAPEEERYDDVKVLGRDAFYDEEDIQRVVSKEIRTPGSSNVYSFSFEREAPRTGILYVTFKAWTPGRGKSNGPGPTYAYYDVPVKVYQAFLADSRSSAGQAVWDYLRVRGTVHDHRYQYRAVAGTLMQGGGVYVPRKATAKGFKKRSINEVGVGRRASRQSTLPEQNFLPNRARPSRGAPDRGRP